MKSSLVNEKISFTFNNFNSKKEDQYIQWILSKYVFALFLQFDDLIYITLGWVGLDQTTIKVMRVK